MDFTKGFTTIVSNANGAVGIALLENPGSTLLGSLPVTKLQLAAMARASIPESERSDVFLYVDEFHNFVTHSFADILAEARKCRLGLVLNHQCSESV